MKINKFWTWNLIPEFEDFVFNSPTPKIASELLEANGKMQQHVFFGQESWIIGLMEIEKQVRNQNHHFIMIFHILILAWANVCFVAKT